MIFNRVLLRAAVVRALEDARNEHENIVEAQRTRWAEERNAWVLAHESDWRVACACMIAKLNEGKPIVESDLPRSRRYGGVETYRMSSPASTGYFNARNEPCEHRPPQHLIDFLTVLDLSNDETVTSNALKDLGFGNLKKIVSYLTPTPDKK